jgi:hypothetical protein
MALPTHALHNLATPPVPATLPLSPWNKQYSAKPSVCGVQGAAHNVDTTQQLHSLPQKRGELPITTHTISQCSGVQGAAHKVPQWLQHLHNVIKAGPRLRL